jgi:hypothetical protein
MMLNPKNVCLVYHQQSCSAIWCRPGGIDTNPTKVEAIKKLQSPRTRREIQKLVGMMAALSRFISKLGEYGMSFYKLLRKAGEFQWDDQAAAAFVQLKQYMKLLPTLVPPQP